jgi:hypothetical protein
VLARLIESGRFDRHLRRMRKIYAGQRDALFAALDEHAPDIRRTGLAASFHAVAQLARAPAKLTWSRLRGPGVGIYGMSANRSTIPRPTPARARIWKPFTAGNHRGHHWMNAEQLRPQSSTLLTGLEHRLRPGIRLVLVLYRGSAPVVDAVDLAPNQVR